jgi:hypothetical protein
VGLLLATRHYPVCTGSVADGRDTTLVLTAFAMFRRPDLGEFTPTPASIRGADSCAGKPFLWR